MLLRKHMILLSWLVIFTMLGSSVGLSIYRHVCSSSGIVETGVGNEDHCCGSMLPKHMGNDCADSNANFTIEPSCCEFQVKHVNMPVISVVGKTLDLNPVFIHAAIPVESFISEPFLDLVSWSYQDLDPPLPDCDIFSLYSIYRI